ncbi:MAG: exonuclease domain-containing protein [Burkholderiaceae bacterium]
MFADHLVFVDVETTGTSPRTARVTEVGVVEIRSDGDGGWSVDEWSSLVDPQCAIPPQIQFLTGITQDMVAGAPRFADLAPGLRERLQGAVMVAHNARFDYGFLKAEFARAGLPFHARTLCTVRLSRLLDPDRSPHSLDAIIARHRLPAPDRHRALGDARVLWAFVRKVWDSHGADAVQAAARRLLRHPALPSHLPADTLQRIPRAPGAYQFLGEGDQPLYIGKSVCLRERVASHFVDDHRHERGLRLASEVRRIDWQRTAGELGALLLEARWIRERLPSHNVALRRQLAEVVIAPLAQRKPRLLKLSDVDVAALPGHFGPFASRAAARTMLLDLCRRHRLCAKRLGLERGPADAPCFNRQLGRCDGACVGAQADDALIARLDEALAPSRIAAWEGGPLAVRERFVEATDAMGGPSGADGAAEDWLVFDRWCYVGRAGDEDEARRLATGDGPLTFDTNAYRLIRRVRERPPPGVVLQPLDARYSSTDTPSAEMPPWP